MDSSVAIKLRLSRSAWDRYSSEAAALSKPLSSYLRERLEREDEMLAELASIRRAMENLASRPAAAAASPDRSGMLLEVLLLCRVIAQPQRMDMVQAELRRLGLNVWEAPAEEPHSGSPAQAAPKQGGDSPALGIR